MKKRVFIGSSTSALPIARSIASELEQLNAIEPVLWLDIFPAGSITFDAIEKESRMLAGAIMIAAPDDKSIINSQEIYTARGNVILELGYFAAVMGRERTMVAKFDETTLPTDLNGVTYLSLGKYVSEGRDLSIDIRKKIKKWAESLPQMPDEISYNNVVHGYCGRWEMSLVFDKWRGHVIASGEYVHIPSITVSIDAIGTFGGTGVMYGELLVDVLGCSAKFNVVDKIRHVKVHRNGVLEFTSETFARQRMEIQGAKPSRMDGFEENLTTISQFEWKLGPEGLRPGCLVGKYETYLGKNVYSSANVTAKKR